MTSAWAFLVCLIAGVSSAGQKGQDSAGSKIEILKLRWEKQVRLSRNFDPAVIPNNGAFSDPGARTTAPVNPADAVRTATAARSAAASSDSAFPETPRRLPVFYVYSMKIKNSGTKTIEGVAWDYLFLDPNDSRELGKHEFLSYEKISTDKIATLRSQLRSPPTRIVQASNSRTKNQPKFIERAAIHCLLYSDGTMWRSSSAHEGLCDLLMNGKALARRKRSAT